MSIHDLGKKIKDGLGRNDLGIPAIILRSFLYSFCFNIIYLFFESACVWVGFIPFAFTSQGGECVQYIGRYWSITYFYPLTTADDPNRAPEPEKAFSFIMVLITLVAVTFIIFVILCIKNGYAKKVLVIIGAIAVTVCGVIVVKMAVNKWNDTPMELSQIQVITSDLHPDVVNALEYPGQALTLVPAGSAGNLYGYSEVITIENGKDVTEVSRKELEALLDAASAAKEQSITKYSGDFAYKVEITYRTRGGYYRRMYFRGFNEFPEEWAEFARLVNEICGGEYLRENPELVAYTDAWFSETYGIRDSGLPEGASIQGMKDYIHSGIEMDRICGNGAIGSLRAYDGEEELNRYLKYLQNNSVE